MHARDSADAGRARCPGEAHRASSATAAFLLGSLLLLPGCATDKPATEAAAEPATAWPCDAGHTPMEVCWLEVADGFQQRSDPDVARFEDAATDATLTARVFAGPRGEAGLAQVQELIDARRLTLSPVVSWDQDPQGPSDVEVQGISGSERLPLGQEEDPGQRQWHRVTYRNPATGSILMLEASAPVGKWSEAWPRLTPTFSRVHLNPAF